MEQALKYLVFLLLFVSISGFAKVKGPTFTVGIHERTFYREKISANVWAGVDIDIVQAIFDQTDYHFEFVEYPWKRTLKMIEIGNVDIALSAARLPEREAFAFFTSVSFRQGHNVLFIDNKKQELFKGVGRLSDLKGLSYKLGVIRGISYSDEFERLVTEEWFSANLITLDEGARLPRMLLLGRIDGYLDSEYGGLYRINDDLEYKSRIKAHGYATTFQEAQTYLMFSKKSVTEAQVAVFDEALRKIKEDGQYARLLGKYGLKPDTF